MYYGFCCCSAGLPSHVGLFVYLEVNIFARNQLRKRWHCYRLNFTCSVKSNTFLLQLCCCCALPATHIVAVAVVAIDIIPFASLLSQSSFVVFYCCHCCCCGNVDCCCQCHYSFGYCFCWWLCLCAHSLACVWWFDTMALRFYLLIIFLLFVVCFCLRFSVFGRLSPATCPTSLSDVRSQGFVYRVSTIIRKFITQAHKDKRVFNLRELPSWANIVPKCYNICTYLYVCLFTMFCHSKCVGSKFFWYIWQLTLC